MKASRGSKKGDRSSATYREISALPGAVLGDPGLQPTLRAASAICRAQGVQFTELRQRLLLALWVSPIPMSAYELMHRLEETWGRSLVPMTVYRALHALLDVNLIARIESHNAYVPRSMQGRPNASVFLICTQCKSATEIQDVFVEKRLNASAGDVGFLVQRTALEIHGRCVRCQDTTQSDPIPTRASVKQAINAGP
jgi:Fur family zinc uptake transcriptional regulator